MARIWGLFLVCFLMCGCTTITVGNYIQSDHPYARKIYGDYDKIVTVIRQVMEKNGYKITGESYPSVYERPVDVRQETPKDLLLFSVIRQHSLIIYSSYTHVNVYIRSIIEGADVEVRFGKITSTWVKQIHSSRNDRLGNKILNEIEQAMLVN